MAYQRLEITDLKTMLTAAQVSHIEDGIIQNESDIADNAKAIAELNTKIGAIKFGRGYIESAGSATFDSSPRVLVTYTFPSEMTDHTFCVPISVQTNNGYVQGTITSINYTLTSCGLNFQFAGGGSSTTATFNYDLYYIYADK